MFNPKEKGELTRFVELLAGSPSKGNGEHCKRISGIQENGYEEEVWRMSECYQHLDQYVEGDKVWFQYKDCNAWIGPALVIRHRGNSVWVH